jgi:hypothetical protein
MKNSDSEGYMLLGLLVLIIFILFGIVNNWMFVKDAWRLLLWLSQQLSNFINEKI